MSESKSVFVRARMSSDLPYIVYATVSNRVFIGVQSGSDTVSLLGEVAAVKSTARLVEISELEGKTGLVSKVRAQKHSPLTSG